METEHTPPDFDRELGRKLRYCRTLRGLSQEELGRKVGVTFQQIQKYEKGINRMPVSRLVQIADVLQVPLTMFFADLSLVPPTEQDRSLLSMVKAFTRVPNPRFRDALISLARVMGEEANQNPNPSRGEYV